LEETSTNGEYGLGAKEMSMYEKLHFKIISFVHDTLYGIFVNPYKLLDAAGLKPGQKVLEVGCGPGFFTIPAAKIVGAEGVVYALDVNPFAVETVQRKVEKEGLDNVKILFADAAKTGLPDESVDLAFLFGVIHALEDVDAVMQEMHRVLKAKGILSVQKSWWSEKQLINVVTRSKLFSFIERKNRIFKFNKV